MKRLLFALLLAGISLSANAGFITGVVVGSALSGDKQPTKAGQTVIVQGKSTICLFDVNVSMCRFHEANREVMQTPSRFVERVAGKPAKIVGTAYIRDSELRSSYVYAVFEYEEQ